MPRVLGTNVIAVPEDVKAIETPEPADPEVGLGISEETDKIDNPLVFVVAAAGPGYKDRNGNTIPLSVKSGDRIVVQISNKSLKEGWKQKSFMYDNQRVLSFEGYNLASESGDMLAVLDSITPNPEVGEPL